MQLRLVYIPGTSICTPCPIRARTCLMKFTLVPADSPCPPESLNCGHFVPLCNFRARLEAAPYSCPTGRVAVIPSERSRAATCVVAVAPAWRQSPSLAIMGVQV
jgi:hypothetical protein